MDARVVCLTSSGALVEKPFLVYIKDMFVCWKRQSDLGEPKYKELAEMLSTLSEDDLKKVCYHSAHRKLVINKQHFKRVEDQAKASTSNKSPHPKKGKSNKKSQW